MGEARAHRPGPVSLRGIPAPPPAAWPRMVRDGEPVPLAFSDDGALVPPLLAPAAGARLTRGDF